MLIASTLAERRFSPFEIGIVLGSVVAGTVAAQLAVGRWADRWGRRRSYSALYIAIGLAAITYATSSPIWLMVVVSLSGALSTEVIESGPFTTLELSMLAGRLDSNALAKGFGWYNAIAASAGAAGALAASIPERARRVWPQAPPDRVWLLGLVAVAVLGCLLTSRLSLAVEAPTPRRGSESLGASRPTVFRLSSLFAVDAFAGGFVVQTFIAFWLIDNLRATTAMVGILFAVIGVVQTLSFLAAPLLARRFGLLNTMVFTHLPSNLFLAAVAFSPNFSVAAAMLLGRAALSQMDVPTRQAYVVELVRPEERTAAIAYTNTARYIARPLGPFLASAVLIQAVGAPFLIAGVVKSIYDLVLWRWFKSIPLTHDRA